MTDKFTSALLAALNESGEMKESDWNSIEAALRQPVDAVEAIEQNDVVDQGAAIEAVEPAEPADISRQAAPQFPERQLPERQLPERQGGENRFAATISSGMAKIRAGG